MTDPAQMPEARETISFLRRFADLMSKGENAKYLSRAADLLETLTADVAAARDEESLWRYKHETAIQHADALEAECEALKQDIDGHLNITTTILSERDNLKSTLQERETALAELRASLQQERGEFANKTQAQQEAMQQERGEFANRTQAQEEAITALRIAFDQEREALKGATEVQEQALDQLTAAVSEEKKVLAELRRERDELQAKIAAFDAKRTEIRSAFERISNLRNQTSGNGGHAGSGAGAPSLSSEPGEQTLAAGETNAVVLKATLRQARAQFQYLAKECVVRGDLASQVMCELGAYTMDLALTDRRETAEPPVGEVALNILAAPNLANG
jgi:chromosome segregation ATPase